MIDRDLAMKARQKGVPGMTRMYGGYHTVTGNYDDLMNWFLNEGVFLRSTFEIVSLEEGKRAFTFSAIVMDDMQTIAIHRARKYWTAMEGVFNKLLDDLPDKKGVTM